MSVTEAEAKTKWCPFVRVSNAASGTWNRFDKGHVSEDVYYNCIGSACMAWRVAQEFEFKRTTTHYEKGLFKDVPPDGEGWQNMSNKQAARRMEYTDWARPKHPDKGFCGLAGAADA